jgi:hypothetical protein
MSVFKPFITSDVIVSPFKVNKSFTFEGRPSLTGSGIDLFEGENTSPDLWISGSTQTGYISSQDKYLIYRSIRELYYYNYLLDNDGSPVSTASFNLDGTIEGQKYTPNAYNYLPNTLLANRYFPTGSGNKIGVISIPSNLYGEYIKPGTFHLEIGPVLSEPRTILVDDGEGNILTGSLKVGDIIYQHGMIILTSDGIPGQDGYGFVNYGSTNYGDDDVDFVTDFINNPDITCSFQSTITLYETQYKCTIRENESNFSQNPTLISGSSNSGVLYDFATGSYFTPYITTIGLYNNDKELLAVAKLSQPLRVSDTTDTSIMINLDL